MEKLRAHGTGRTISDYRDDNEQSQKEMHGLNGSKVGSFVLESGRRVAQMVGS